MIMVRSKEIRSIVAMGKYIRKLPVRQLRSPGNRPKNGIFPEKRRMIPVIISPIPNNIKILPV
jgi:hypothetical protein